MSNATNPAEPPGPSGATPAGTAGPTETRTLPLHVVDLGTEKGSAVRDLKRGRGKLLDEIADTVADIEASIADEAVAKNLIPVVMIVERKRSRKKK